MKRLVVATRNAGKLKEIHFILRDLHVEVSSLLDYPDLPPAVEDGETFEANASKKALHVARATGLPALADDSGLEVDALGGAPGVHSARFAGPEATDEANNSKLLRLLKDVPEEKRSARFRCVIAVATPEGRVELAEGVCEGRAASKERGDKGFGYDPLFYVAEYGMTFFEVDGVCNVLCNIGSASSLSKSPITPFM